MHCDVALATEVLMAIPYRGSTGNGTYFITASTFEKKCILQSERMAGILINVFSHYQKQANINCMNLLSCLTIFMC